MRAGGADRFRGGIITRDRVTGCIEIAGRAIGPRQPPYLIAELSGNHMGSIDLALELLEAARDAGADAAKIQTYTADSITIDHDGPGFVIEEGLWSGRTLHELYRQAETPPEWHQQLFEKALSLQLTLFSSPFDAAAVDLLETLDTPAYKIASFEIVDLELIRCAAATGKPMIMSTGLATKEEIAEGMKAAQDGGCESLALLHCVSGYPTPAKESNLRTIADLADSFDTVVGLSDHSLGTAVSVAAVAAGASIIEKHFVMRRADGGVDAAFSLEPQEFRALVRDCRDAFDALGVVDYGIKDSERAAREHRRSLYAVADIAAGETLSAANVRSIRPGFGLHTRHLKEVVGQRAAIDIRRGTPLSWDILAAGRPE